MSSHTSEGTVYSRGVIWPLHYLCVQEESYRCPIHLVGVDVTHNQKDLHGTSGQLKNMLSWTWLMLYSHFWVMKQINSQADNLGTESERLCIEPVPGQHVLTEQMGREWNKGATPPPSQHGVMTINGVTPRSHTRQQINKSVLSRMSWKQEAAYCLQIKKPVELSHAVQGSGVLILH